VASVGTVVAALQRAVDALHEAVNHVRAAQGTAEDGQRLGKQIDVRAAVERFSLVTAGTERLEAMLVVGIEMVQQTIAKAEAIRGGAAAAGVAPASPTGPPAGARPAPFFRRSVAAQVRARRTQQTFGIATDTDGNRLHGGELASGHPKHAPVDPTAGIRDPRTRALTAVGMHVEGRVAALMRQADAPRDVILYLNNQVCRGRNGGRG
jgi:hypothetical protein